MHNIFILAAMACAAASTDYEGESLTLLNSRRSFFFVVFFLFTIAFITVSYMSGDWSLQHNTVCRKNCDIFFNITS